MQKSSFVKKHEALIKEISYVMDCFRHVMERVKRKGLSIKSYRELRRYILKEHVHPDNTRLSGVMVKVWAYLKEAKLKSGGWAHNLSSDIIEFTFGVYNARKSPNNLYRVTWFVLFIPAHAAVVGMQDCTSIDFKRILAENYLNDTKNGKK